MSSRGARRRVVTAIAGLVVVSGCASEGSGPVFPTAPSASPSSAAELQRALRCTGSATGAPLRSQPGVVSYACVGTITALAPWIEAKRKFLDFESATDPGPAPRFAELVMFPSVAARDRFAANDRRYYAVIAKEQSPTYRQIYRAQGLLPDVLGPRWLVRGNDATVRSRATAVTGG